MELTEIERLRREVTELLALRDRAAVIAHANLDRRLDAMNEFREALNDQSKTFISRAELDLRLDRVMDRLVVVEAFKNNLQGRMTVTVALMGAFFTLLQIALAFLLRPHA